MADIRSIPVKQARILRHKILRPNQSPEECIYPGDDDERTGHFGAFTNDVHIGIASIFPEAHPDLPASPAWRIRGMATEAAVRGEGMGALLLEACIAHARKQNGSIIWCNARSTVTGFYGKYGFQPVGDEFPLPGIGPHYLMVLNLDQ